MSKRRKGNDNEQRVCWHYKHLGYDVWMPSWGGRGHGLFRSTDIMGVFDVMAWNEQEIVLIQVKSGTGFRKKVEAQIKEIRVPSNVKKVYYLFKPNGQEVKREY